MDREFLNNLFRTKPQQCFEQDDPSNGDGNGTNTDGDNITDRDDNKQPDAMAILLETVTGLTTTMTDLANTVNELKAGKEKPKEEPKKSVDPKNMTPEDIQALIDNGINAGVTKITEKMQKDNLINEIKKTDPNFNGDSMSLDSLNYIKNLNTKAEAGKQPNSNANKANGQAQTTQTSNWNMSTTEQDLAKIIKQREETQEDF